MEENPQPLPASSLLPAGHGLRNTFEAVVSWWIVQCFLSWNTIHQGTNRDSQSLLHFFTTCSSSVLC